MNTRQQPRTTRSRQAGMVSIIVTMIMMLVISLIVLGFATVSRREQRSSLDRQLSTQAFFAAESGVNDARKVIIEKVRLGESIPEKTTCAPNADYNPAGTSNVLSVENNVSYSCLLVNTRLNNLTVSPVVAGGKSTNLPLEPVGTMTNLHINWKSLSTPTPPQVAKCKNIPPSNSAFPRNTAVDWECPYGVMRMDIVPNAGSLSRAAIASTNPAGQKTIFFYPTNNASGGTRSYATSNGAVAEMKCQSATGCDMDITGIPNGNYMLRISGIYKNGTAVITAQDASGTDLELRNAQIQVDVTGKAQDVLRRVQVRLPMSPSAGTPDYAIQSGSSICKRFESSPTAFLIPNDIQDQDQNNPMCRPTTVAVTPACVAPNDVLLAPDVSGSMLYDFGTSGRSREDVLMEVLDTFIGNTNITPTGTHAGMMFWDAESRLQQSFTGDPNLLRNALSLYAPDDFSPTDGTHFTNALNGADGYLYGTGARPTSPKILIFITDGEVNRGDTYPAAAAAAQVLKDKGVIIYAIGVDDETNTAGLSAIAGNGGYYANGANPISLNNILTDISSRVSCL